MSKILYHCAICSKPLLRYKCHVNTNTPVCSRVCKSALFKIKFSGTNNSNYGNKWTYKQRKKQSDLIKSRVTDEYRYKSGSGNRGKKFTQERIDKMHGSRDSASYSHPHTEETKKRIGELSRAKFTESYKDKQRQLREKKGYWVPLEEKDNYMLYRDYANWVDKMFDIVDSNGLLEKHGVFNNKTNTRGVVRDHILSRRTGYEKGIYPEILRHPCNCQIITQSDNIKKKKSRYTDADGITVEELFNKIISYEKSWKEQETCLQLIRKYKNGSRYNKQLYINKHYETNN